MLPTRDQILDLLKAPEYGALKMKELAKRLDVTQPEYRKFRASVKEMVEEGLLVKGDGNRYAHKSHLSGDVGALRVHKKGFGFVSVPGKEADFFIGKGEMNGALDGDTVRVQSRGYWSREGLPQGYISEIIAESKKEFMGLLRRRGQRWIVDVDDVSLPRDVFVDIQGVKDAVEGYRVTVKIIDRKSEFRGLVGEITDVLGDPESAHLDYDTVVRRFSIQEAFSTEALNDANVRRHIGDELGRRRDLRSQPCVTIDPEAARDHDDAVAIERTAENGYRLFVHIADVSHYVREETALDREALQRGCSAYLIDRVVHMLPEELAAKQCSLVPGEDRLALTVEVEMGTDGQVIHSDIYESVICSQARLNYGQVQSILDGNETGDDGLREWIERLHWMAELSQLRQQIRLARGSLDLDVPEAVIALDEQGEPVSIGRYPRWESNRLIEEFMLVANECVGRFCAKRNVPVLYRVHAPPSAEKVESVFKLLDRGRKQEKANIQPIKPKDFQRLLNKANTLPNAALYSKLLLRSLSRAEYKPEDEGHFGLGCAQYLHFTSPIRRYPDLLVHRALKRALRGNPSWKNDRNLWSDMGEYGRQTSTLERKAEAAERAYKKMKQLRYMKRHIGDVFEGCVSGVLRSGFFVEIDEFLVDGYVPSSDLNQPVDFDGEKQRLVLRRSRKAIELGMPVQVVVCAVDLNALEMDLALAENENASLLGRQHVVGGKRKKKKGMRKTKKKRKGR